LGGTDQLYNLLAGREVMEQYGVEPQIVLTTPLLLSWDGEKMSSSVGNNIPLTMAPEEMFGRTMRIPDSMLADWWRLVLEAEPPGLIAQGGVKLDGEAVGELDLPRARLVGAQIQVGKRRYATLTEA